MTATAEPALCVFCRRRPQENLWRPFCCERCKIQDLAQWADGGYRVAAAPAPNSEDAESDHEQPNSSAHRGQDRQD